MIESVCVRPWLLRTVVLTFLLTAVAGFAPVAKAGTILVGIRNSTNASFQVQLRGDGSAGTVPGTVAPGAIRYFYVNSTTSRAKLSVSFVSPIAVRGRVWNFDVQHDRSYTVNGRLGYYPLIRLTEVGRVGPW